MVPLIVDSSISTAEGSDRCNKQQNVYSRPSATPRFAQSCFRIQRQKPGRFTNTLLDAGSSIPLISDWPLLISRANFLFIAIWEQRHYNNVFSSTSVSEGLHNNPPLTRTVIAQYFFNGVQIVRLAYTYNVVRFYLKRSKSPTPARKISPPQRLLCAPHKIRMHFTMGQIGTPAWTLSPCSAPFILHTKKLSLLGPGRKWRVRVSLSVRRRVPGLAKDIWLTDVGEMVTIVMPLFL